MSTQPTQPLFEVVRKGEKKKLPLLEALAASRLDRANIGEFVTAMNDLGGSLGAELIAKAWPDLDAECRLQIFRDWLDRKENDQQAGGFHALAAKLLTIDPGASMDLLDRVYKFASNSPPCLKRVLSTTRTEWIATTPGQSKLSCIDIHRLNTSGRLTLLDWISDSCKAEPNASDADRRKVEQQTSIVAAWFNGIRGEQLPEPIAKSVDRNLGKLGAKGTGNAVLASTSNPTTAQSPAIGNPPDSPVKFQKEIPAVADEPNEMLREAFKAISQLFKKQSDQHTRDARAIAAELETLKNSYERAEREAADARIANGRLIEKLTHLEERLGGLQDTHAKTDMELSAARAKVDSLGAELERERREKQALRDESHQAVAREIQRERERMLVQLGQRLGNIVDGYREIRSRGPLPEGAPAMLGDMMDELLSTLNAAGVKIEHR